MDKSHFSFYLLLILFFLIPLFIFPFAEDSYLIPKYTLLNFGVLLIIFILTIKDKSKIINLKSAIVNRASYILWLFFFFNVISLIYAPSVPLALKEIEKWLFLIILYSVFILVIRTGKQLQKIIYTILLAGLFTAIWTVLQDYHIDFGFRISDFGFRFNVIPRLPDWRGFLVAGLGNSDYVAGFLVSVFPLGFVQYAVVKEKKQKFFLLVCLSLIYAALIITFSVGANSGLILGMILVLLLGFNRRLNIFRISDFGFRIYQQRWLWLILIFGLITAFYVLPIPFNGRGESIFRQAFASNRWKEGGNTRLVIWANTWELIKSNPILGTGAGNFTYRYLDYTAPQVLSEPRMKIYSGEYTNAAHNELLHTWSELGILGVIILLILIASFYFSAAKLLVNNSAIRNPQSEIYKVLLPSVLLGAIGGFTAMLVYGMMSYPLHLPATAMLFIFYLALPKIISNIENNELQQKPEICNLKSKISKAPLSTIYCLLSTILFLLLAFWTIRPLIADTYFRMGKDALNQQNESRALTAFMNATKWDTHADAQYHLGELYLRGKEYGGQLTLAISEFESARKQRNDKYLLYELGIAYQMAEQYQDALGCFKPLTQRQPDNPEYWERLSFIYLKLGNTKLSHEAHLKAEEARTK
jgi:O-antigen ligase